MKQFYNFNPKVFKGQTLSVICLELQRQRQQFYNLENKVYHEQNTLVYLHRASAISKTVL